ncbi:MAG: hypothetical protein WC211_00920 [Dehalococcoidia bacterium]
MNWWAALSAVISPPAVLYVLRIIRERTGAYARASASEIDYLRAESKREREECAVEKARDAGTIAGQAARIHELERIAAENALELQRAESTASALLLARDLARDNADALQAQIDAGAEDVRLARAALRGMKT